MEQRKARIAVLVSGGGTNLQAILDAQISGVLHSGEVTLVISDRPGAYALTRAEKAGVPGLEIDRKACGGQNAFEERLISALRNRRPLQDVNRKDVNRTKPWQKNPKENIP